MGYWITELQCGIMNWEGCGRNIPVGTAKSSSGPPKHEAGMLTTKTWYLYLPEYKSMFL